MKAREHGSVGPWEQENAPMPPCARAPMLPCPHALLRLAAACAALLTAGLAAAKPTAPILLTAAVTESDPAAGTARVEIRARSLVPAAAVHVQCDLPKGAAIVPGSGEWGTNEQGEKVLTMRITLPPAAGKAVVRADLRGEGINIGRIVGLDLPPVRAPGQAAAAPAAEDRPRIITTSKGEKLRVHKQ